MRVTVAVFAFAVPKDWTAVASWGSRRGRLEWLGGGFAEGAVWEGDNLPDGSVL